ncbi:MAG: signal peptidase II [Fimbriimonadales bacterium]
MNRRALFWISFIGLVVLDQVVKGWARSAMPEGSSIALPWPGVLELKLVFNHGVAFGMFQGAGVLLAPVAILIAGWAAYHSWKHAEEAKWVHFGLAMLASGALGNLWDRLTQGKVTDLFWIRVIDFPVFNVADICITFAAVVMVFWLRKAESPKPATAPETPAS